MHGAPAQNATRSITARTAANTTWRPTPASGAARSRRTAHGTRKRRSEPCRMPAKRFGKARPSGEPSGSTERKIRILLELIRNKSVRMSRLCDDYDIAERSILRDFQELRKIGERAGFTLSQEVENDRMT